MKMTITIDVPQLAAKGGWKRGANELAGWIRHVEDHLHEVAEDAKKGADAPKGTVTLPKTGNRSKTEITYRVSD